MRIEIIATDLLDPTRVSSILALKSQHWPHPIESQLKWFKQNARPSDEHVLGWSRERLVGYLRIVSGDGLQTCNAVPLAIFDTVCIDRDHHRQSLGLELMAAASRAVQLAGKVGLLACALDHVLFYKRCNWQLFSWPLRVSADMRPLLPEGAIYLFYDPAVHLTATALDVVPRLVSERSHSSN